MGVIRHDGRAYPGQMILAHEPPFTLGTLSVQPATRQVASGNQSETLEPRVMQVLVALFRADGIVTRDELIERCWSGRVVGEDAINRALSRIRHVGGGIGAGSFRVETIAKVGYRLIGKETRPVDPAPSTPAAVWSLDRRRMIGGIVVAGSLGAIGATGAWRSIKRPEVPPPAARSLYNRALTMRYSGSAANNRQAIARA